MKDKLGFACLCAGVTLLVYFATGCTKREIHFGGATYKSWRFGNVEKLGAIEVHQGDSVFRVESFESDQVSMAKAIAEGVAKGLKP